MGSSIFTTLEKLLSPPVNVHQQLIFSVSAPSRATSFWGSIFDTTVKCQYLSVRDGLSARLSPDCVFLSRAACCALPLPAFAPLLKKCSKDEAQRLLAIFIPDVKGYTLSRFEAGSLKCELSAGAVIGQLREVWFLAHLVGW